MRYYKNIYTFWIAMIVLSMIMAGVWYYWDEMRITPVQVVQDDDRTIQEIGEEYLVKAWDRNEAELRDILRDISKGRWGVDRKMREWCARVRITSALSYGLYGQQMGDTHHNRHEITCDNFYLSMPWYDMKG